MAPIVESIEVGRSPEDVFAYVGDLSRHGEWQGQIVDVRVETDGPTRVGSRATETRRVPGGPRKLTYEITEWDPPRKASFRGQNGPIRAVGTLSVEPVGDGSRSRITLRLDFEGRGLGKLLLPLVRRDARKQVPQDQARLKERLESGA
jgi:Polyketide cyclase / dehydrase and lipid transport